MLCRARNSMLCRARNHLLLLAGLFLALAAHAQQNLLEGFSKLPEGARVVLMPMDVELFSISGGGVLEPQAEWTDNALKHLKSAYYAKKQDLKADLSEMSDEPDETIDDLNRLHGAVGTAINLHHLGILKLPTKDSKLDWTLGDSVSAIKQKTKADYALFTFVRDSYASGERVAAMLLAAAFGVGLGGGVQTGYASLIDLSNGRVVWFNRLLRATGDLREADKARESLDSLLKNFPG